MKNSNTNQLVISTIEEQARTQFFLEDKLERDFHAGFISEEEYQEGLQGIFRNFETMYGFQIPTENRGLCPLCREMCVSPDEFQKDETDNKN